MTKETSRARNDVPADASLIARSSLGGVLMGLANLVPGISGGTMLLAAGIYPDFVGAVADATRLRWRVRSAVVLGIVVLSAGIGILVLAGLLKDLVLDHRWVMYSLFIGLTLGGLPLVWRMARPITSPVWAGAGLGFAAMAALAVLQSTDVSGAQSSGMWLLFVAGLAGASAMILPGVSGGYLLLLLGQYVPILSAIDEFKTTLLAGDMAGAISPASQVLVPVGLGVVAGVVVVSNLLRVLLERFPKVTLGVLAGLLLGSVVGLWPFRQSFEPIPGETLYRGEVVTEQSAAAVPREDWPERRFAPTAGQAAAAAGLGVAGLLLTLVVSRIGDRGSQQRAPADPEPASVANG